MEPTFYLSFFPFLSFFFFLSLSLPLSFPFLAITASFRKFELPKIVGCNDSVPRLYSERNACQARISA